MPGLFPVYKRTVVYAVNEKKNVTDITGNAKDVDENIDLSPSVTQAQVAEGIRIYAQNTLNEETENYAEIEVLTDSNLCIYNLSKDGQSHLLYAYGFPSNVGISNTPKSISLHVVLSVL